MDSLQKSRAYKIDKQVPGCLGRMVNNLFDVGAGVSASKLLTDKPHRDARNRSQVVRKLNPSSGNKKATPDLRNVYYIKPHPTSMKMLSSANEMSKESKHGSKNVVARLMGLDALPQHQQQQGYYTTERSSQSKGYPLQHSSSQSMLVPGRHWPQDHVFPSKRMMRYRTYRHHQEHNNDYKDVYEVQKEFKEVLSSNKELLLRVLKEPNALTSKATFVPQKTNRITVLRPSKMDRERFPYKNSPGAYVGDEYDNSHPTQIVVLKPSGLKTSLPSASPRTFDGDEVENGIGESRQMANEANYHRHRSPSLSDGRHETSVSSDWYAPESFIDCEVVPSPPSRHYSWDYVNRLDSPFSLSSLSRASCSPETSVCREAKSRLSERMAMMACNGTSSRDERRSGRSSYTLGEMLSLSESKKDLVQNLSASTEYGGPEASEVHMVKDSSKKTEASSSFKLKVSSLLFSRNNKRSTEKKSQPSPVSVLELFYEADVQESSGKQQQLPLYYDLSSSIGKSPLIGSVARTLTWDGSSSGRAHTSSSSNDDEEDGEQEWLNFAREFLGTMKCHSPESPLDPSLRRERDSKCCSEARKRQRRSNRKLAFDSMNSALAEITGRYGFDDNLSSTEDRVWDLVREWRAGEWNSGSNNLVVERVARKEVVLGGGFWNQQLRTETHKLGEEIERELLHELMDQTVCHILSTNVL